jgi:hypothetical protein
VEVDTQTLAVLANFFPFSAGMTSSLFVKRSAGKVGNGGNPERSCRICRPDYDCFSACRG